MLEKRKLLPVTKDRVEFALDVIDHGLTKGIGEQEPGEMCVEAVISYALGGDHDDQPECVHPLLRKFKIALNDDYIWKSAKSRAEGLRRLAIVQLGTKNLKWKKFEKALAEKFYGTTLPRMMRAKGDRHKGDDADGFYDAAEICEYYGTQEAAQRAAKMVAVVVPSPSELSNSPDETFDAFDGATEKDLIAFCEDVVQVLIKLKVPGRKWLYLTKKKRKKKTVQQLIKMRKQITGEG